MPITANDLITDFNDVAAEIGVNFVVRHTSGLIFDDYDNVSGTLLNRVSGTGFSGVGAFQPLKISTGGEDLKFLREGLVDLNDSKLYVTGSIPVSGTSIIDIENSGTTFVPLHVIPYNVTGSSIYNLVFVRRLRNNG